MYKLAKALTLCTIAITTAACDDILSGLYDTPAEETVSANEAFTVTTENGMTRGSVTVDATNYTKWVYIDLHDLSTAIGRVPTSAAEIDTTWQPDNWDIAVHRYDAKTNGASVAKTDFTTIDDFLANGTIPTDGYVEDMLTDTTVIIDMSQMLQNIVGYGYTMYNAKLSEWFYLDRSTMPPGYNLRDNVFIVRFADDTHAAIKLASYMNSANIKGHLTISFAYPID